MPNKKTSRGRSQDRAKVAGGQEHEVRYESGKTGTTPDSVKAAVQKKGNSRKSVEKALSKDNGKKAMSKEK